MAIMIGIVLLFHLLWVGDCSIQLQTINENSKLHDKIQTSKQLSQNTHGNKASCLNLYYNDINDPIPRCEQHVSDCREAPPLDLKLSIFETKPGKRLVGDRESGDRHSCYPLSDEDIFNSRSAVKGNLKLIKSLHARIASATKKKSFKVVTVGGSVTNGGGCGSYALKESRRGAFGACSWTKRFVDWMRKYYGGNNIELISLAQPATTSTWLLSHLHMVMSYNPDLLLVDYGVNDAIIGGISEEVQHMHDSGTRASTERLIKGFYAYNQKRAQHGMPLAAIVYVAMHRVAQDEPLFDNRSYHFSDEVYYPVCKAYGVPVISVRDAVWPSLEDRSRLDVWETQHGAHPKWSGHQLVADLASFAWAAAVTELIVDPTPDLVTTGIKAVNTTEEIEAEIYSQLKDEQEEMAAKPLMFQFGDLDNVCPRPLPPPKSWKGKLLVPVRPAELRDWTWHDHNGKVGWQYYTESDTEQKLAMTAHKLTYHNNNSLPPTFSSHFAQLSLPEILSFNTQFDLHSPGVSVEHLRSYEGFGQVCMWITRGSIDKAELEKTARHALYLAWSNYLMRKFCVELINRSTVGRDKLKLKLHGRPKGRDVCEHIAMGTWSDPTILEGAWEDKSTQIHVSEKDFGVGFVLDSDLERWRVERFSSPHLFFSDKPHESLSDVLNMTAPLSQVVEGQVHFMPVPWSFEGMTDIEPVPTPAHVPWSFDTKGVRKFKIMGINSC